MTPVTFTIEELWLLHAFVRHEVQGMETWFFPPADLNLNDQIVGAIVACVDSKMPEYTLLLTQQQLLVIDYWIRREYMGPPVRSGQAQGAEILLKTFRARLGEIRTDTPTTDLSYKEVSHADTSTDEDADGYTYPDAF